MTTAKKLASVPSGINIVRQFDGDSFAGCTWFEARNQRGETLMESESVRGCWTADAPAMKSVRDQFERDVIAACYVNERATTTNRRKTMYAVIRLDGNYGTVISRHRTAESAGKKFDKLCSMAPANAMVWLMYRVIELDHRNRLGDRVRAV